MDHDDGGSDAGHVGRTDEQQLDGHAAALVAAVDAAVGDWVRRCVRSRCAGAGVVVDDAIAGSTEAAAAAARTEVVAALEALFALDVDEQAGTPLQILRDAVRHPTRVLAQASVPPVDRDEFDRRAFPDDLYGLIPAGFGDVDPSLVEPAIAWGAAKAHVHLRRHAR